MLMPAGLHAEVHGAGWSGKRGPDQLALLLPPLCGPPALLQAGLQTLSVRLGTSKVYWTCIALLEAAYLGAMLVGGRRELRKHRQEREGSDLGWWPGLRRQERGLVPPLQPAVTGMLPVQVRGSPCAAITL